MAKYSKGAGKKVKRALHEEKRGKLKSGRSGKKVTSRKQAIAIGLSEARKSGAKVPKKASKSGRSKSASKKSSSRKSASKKSSKAGRKSSSRKSSSKKGASKRGSSKKSSKSSRSKKRK
jgi:hypothetical protein